MDAPVKGLSAAQQSANTAAAGEEVNGGTNGRVTQPRQRHDLHDLDALLVQPHDLLASLVKLLQCLLSCVFFFHELWIRESQ